MSSTVWTDEQKSAFTVRSDGLLVSAAAGSGKTAVLVERILRYISDPVDPVDIDRLLVVTFTNAAAAEMRQRIGAKIASSPRLQRQLNLLNRASITTLHSFCLDILRQHFHYLDMDPHFRVADETEISLLQTDVLDELFENNYNSAHEGFLELVEKYGGERSDDRLQEIVLDLFRYARSQPRPKEWLERTDDSFHVDDGTCIDDFPWCHFLIESIVALLEGAKRDLEKAFELTASPGGPQKYREVLNQDILDFTGLCAAGKKSWSHMYRAFQDFKWGRLPVCGKDVDEEIKEKVKLLRNSVKDEFNKIKERYFSRSPEEYLADMGRTKAVMGELSRLVIAFGEAFQKAKLEKCLVDFSDLEHYCLEILENPTAGLASELRQQYREVLVDEYQDINNVQERILELVSGGKGCFMVGDVKQSIYRFRLAEPGLFLKKYQNFSDIPGASFQKINLSRNFRSRKEIIDGVNFVFKQIMTPGLGEIGYDVGAELALGRVCPDEEIGGVELLLIDRGSAGRKTDDGEAEQENIEVTGDKKLQNNEGINDEAEEITAAQAEARVIAGRIKELAEGEKPQAEYRDIVILLRAAKGWANTFTEELQLAGIPVYADLGTGYFAAVEVDTMLSLLKVIDNPHQDIFLAGVLRSPLFNFTIEELALIRLNGGKEDLFSALLTYTKTEDCLGEKLHNFLIRLDSWRTRARRGKLADLIWDIYSETGYYRFAGTLPGGSQRQANLRALYDRARQYESISFRGLFRFLRFIERLRKGGSDLGTARALGENENVVRIMSVHKSKGLEFPVVFIAGLGKHFNMQDLNGDILMHKELGLGASLVDIETRTSYPTLPKLAIKKKLESEALAEEMRVFYVALTRAKDKLILVGTSRNLKKSVLRWTETMYFPGWYLPDGKLAKDRTWLDWIGRAVIRHETGKVLREAADVGLSEEIAYYPCRWLVRIISPNVECLSPREAETWDKVHASEPVAGSGQWEKEVGRRLGWQYPYGFAAAAAAKISVTGFKAAFETDEIEISRTFNSKKPAFLLEMRGLSAAERGTALHLVMQHLDFSYAGKAEDITRQMERMVEKEILTACQAEAVDAVSIARFFSGPIGKRVLASQDIRRELPFTLAVPAGEIYPGHAAEFNRETVLVQGVIDLLFREQDTWVIVDFKTGHERDFSAERLRAEYSNQLNLYSRAVESIWHVTVSEKYVYLFTGEKLVIIK